MKTGAAFALLFVIASGCSLKSAPQGARVSLVIPELASRSYPIAGRSNLAPTAWNDLSAFKCYVVNVVGDGIPDSSATPNPNPSMGQLLVPTGLACSYRGVVSPPVLATTASTVIDLQVPPGPSRVIQLVGITDANYCSDQFLNKTGGLSVAYEIGRVATDLYGDATVSIPVTYTQANAGVKVVDCSNANAATTVAPTISYANAPFTWSAGSPVNETVTSSGGTVSSCTSSPALPSGVTLASNCDLSGTPTAATPTASYTITAFNLGGSQSAVVSIRVRPSAPDLIALQAPAATPGNVATPTIRVSRSSGTFAAGQVVGIYSDSACTTSLGSATVTGTPTYQDVVSSSLVDGSTTTFYANVSDSGNASACSSVSASYGYDGSAPAAATLLGWGLATPAKTQILTATWTKSTDPQLADQKIQFYTGACSSPTGPLTDLASATAQSQTFNSAGDGTFSYTITSYDAAGNSVVSACSSTILVDTVNPAAASGLGWSQTSPYNSASITATWTAGTDAASGMSDQLIRFYSDSACSVAAGASVDLSSASAASYAYTASADGPYYFAVTSVDAAGNMSVSPCSPAMVVDTSAPSLSSATITNSTPTNTNAYSLSYGTVSGSYAEYCILENDTNSADCAWVSGVLPPSFAVSSVQNAKLLSVWIRDAAHNPSVRADTNAVVLDTVAPAIPSPFLAADTATSSTSVTNKITVNLTATTASDVAGLCLIEQLAASPAPTAPLPSDPCFHSTLLGTGTVTPNAGNLDHAAPYSLTLRGSLKLYLFAKDSLGNVQSSPAIATMSFPLPSSFAVSGPGALGQSECSTGIKFQLMDSNSSISPADASYTVNLSGAGTGVFYDDIACTHAVTSVTIPQGGSVAPPLYFKSSAAASYALSASVSAPSISGNLGVVVSPVYKAASGPTVNCAIVSGQAMCAGGNEFGMLGSTGPDSAFLVPVSLTGFGSGLVTDIAVGRAHVCAVVDGVAACWGDGSRGQLGQGSFSSSTTPVTAIAAGVRSISAYGDVTCAVVGDSAKCWGDGINAQMGIGADFTQKNVPVVPNGLSSGVTAIAVGKTHVCAIQSGSVSCWGGNAAGQLGIGTSGGQSTVPASSVMSNAIAISAGDDSSCAVSLSGTVSCWGSGALGQLGNGLYSQQMSPVSVSGVTGASDVAQSGTHACAFSAGMIKCWGSNFVGELQAGTIGTASSTALSTSMTGYKSLGKGAACAINGVNAPMCWGSNSHGQLANATRQPSSIAELSNAFTGMISDFSSGGGTHCAVIGGSVQCYGMGALGQLGNNATTNSTVPVVASGLSSVTRVSVARGGGTVCAIDSGSLYCWGAGGLLGNAVYDQKSVPTLVSSIGTVASIAVSDDHACAQAGGGNVFCWGNNANGQLGTGSAGGNDPTPQYASTLGMSAAEVVVGRTHSCATDGASLVKCWGGNASGQVGDGTFVDRSSAAMVISTGGTSVAAGDDFTCAVRSGGVYCWGDNTFGQIGNGLSGPSYPTPQPVAGLSSGAVKVFARARTACALMTGGKIMCWGDGRNGQVGNGLSGIFNSPQPLFGGYGTSFTSVMVGEGSACGTASTAYKCWGSNSFDALGDAVSTPYQNTLAAAKVPSASAVRLGLGSASYISGNNCEGIAVFAYNAAGTAVNATGTFSLSDSGAGGAFYSNNTCSTALSLTNVSSAGTAVYYRNPNTYGSSIPIGVEVKGAGYVKGTFGFSW